MPWNSRRFHFSNQLNGLVWSSGDLAQKANTPDVIRGLVVHDQVVRLIGSRTTETWYNAGDALTPFVPVQGTTIDVGMGPLRSAQYVGGAVLAISESQAGNRELLALTSQSPAILTPPGVSLAGAVRDRGRRLRLELPPGRALVLRRQFPLSQADVGVRPDHAHLARAPAPHCVWRGAPPRELPTRSWRSGSIWSARGGRPSACSVQVKSC